MRSQFLFASTLTILLCNTAAINAQPHRTVALTGLSAPIGIGGDTTYRFFGRPSLNEHGKVAFIADLMSPTADIRVGVFSEGGGSGVELLALQGENVPGVMGATYNNLFSADPAINDLGQVLFYTTMEGTAPFEGEGIFITPAGGIPQLILQGNDEAPGTVGRFGTLFSTWLSSKFNNVGQVTINHFLPTQPGISADNNWGIWRADISHPIELVALERESAPGFPGTFTFYGDFPGSAPINDVGQIAFFGGHEVFLPESSNGSGIWMGMPGNVELQVTTGSVSPGIPSGSTFISLGRPSINNAGDYVFSATIDDSAPGIGEHNDSGLWGERNGNPLQLLYRNGEQPVGVSAGAGYGAFATPYVNQTGDIAFLSVLQNNPGSSGTAVSDNDNFGIWSEGGGNGLQLVAREGDHPVGTATNIEFADFGQYVLNARGQMAFEAILRGPGVDATNDSAIFAQDADGLLHLIAREGDSLDVDDGPGVDERTIAVLAFHGGTGNEDGSRSGFNDIGQLAFVANFADNTSGIFLSDRVATTDLLGDYNTDNTVNGVDFLEWQQGNSPNPLSLMDLQLWESSYGSASSIHATSESVPEPSPLLLLTCLFCLAARNRKGYHLRDMVFGVRSALHIQTS